MNWNERENASGNAEAIVALTDGIANNVDPNLLQEYADEKGIPIALQSVTKKATNTSNTPAPVVDDDYDDDEYDDYYESSDYEDSDCW